MYHSCNLHSVHPISPKLSSATLEEAFKKLDLETKGIKLMAGF